MERCTPTPGRRTRAGDALPSGSDWAKLGDDGLDGMFVIHLGDESEFEADRA